MMLSKLFFIALSILLIELIFAERKCFPSDFAFGAATAATQIEGAYLEDKQLSIWDVWAHTEGKTERGDTPDVADDHYHKVAEDVALMKKMGLKNYRLSIAWTRIIHYEKKPNGEIVRSVNAKGVQHYIDEIKQLKAAGIEPMVTLYHWDLPQFIHENYLDWRSQKTINEFVYYADICFKYFGPLGIKMWAPFNEPLSFVNSGYLDGNAPPGLVPKPGGNLAYEVGHNVIIAHALVTRLYREVYEPSQHGKIGIINCGFWGEPRNPNNATHVEASERANIFNVGWWADPLFFGDYPKEMRETAGDRLPKFSAEQKKLLLASRPDWVGFNPYTGRYVEMGRPVPRNQSKGSWDDMHVDWFDTDMNGKKIGEQAESDWIYVVPWSIRRWINWLDKRYEKTPIYITENGCSAPHEDDKPIQEALNDVFRVNYLKSYIEEVYNARVIDGANIQGYYVWSFLDNFEWNGGYKYRFGINYVDYKDPKKTRYQKASSIWYSSLVQTGCLD